MDGVGIVGLALLLSAYSAGIWVWLRVRGAPPEAPITSWRLILPRESRFPPAEAAAFFTGIAPFLTGKAFVIVEFRTDGGEIGLWIHAPSALEAALRGQFAARMPGARLESSEPPPCGESPVSVPLYGTTNTSDLEKQSGEEAPDTLLTLLGYFSQVPRGTGPCGYRMTVSAAPGVGRAVSALRSAREALLRPRPASKGGVNRPHPSFRASLLAWSSGESNDSAADEAARIARFLKESLRDPTGPAPLSSGKARPLPSLHQGPESRPPPLLLSATDLGRLFHLPATTTLIHREQSRLTPVENGVETPPPNPSNDLCYLMLGEAYRSDGWAPFGIGQEERRLHAYVVGKTGTGKSTFLASLIRQDLEAGRGVGLLDPHGQLAEQVLSLVPESRKDDLLYFNPADVEWPVPFNPLAAASPELRPYVVSNVVGIFKKLYGDSWGPRLEYFLRNTLLALLESPAPSLLVLPRLLTDREYRRSLLPVLQDPVLRAFFEREFEAYDPRWRAEAVSPILNKVGAFIGHPLLRNVIGPAGPGFDLRRVMDTGGIFLANLSLGRIGEDNSSLLGALLVAAFGQAAVARADVPEGERRDFHLYIDEFQHFASDAFAAILSEARKYRLSLTLSHQYLEQVPRPLTEAVLGNTGTLVCFRVGSPDARRLAPEFAPSFDEGDLLHLPDFQCCVRLHRRGRTLPPFSARSPGLPGPTRDPAPLIQASREKWARPRPAIEVELQDLLEGRLDKWDGPTGSG